jgi:hypothetical protein
MNFDDVKNDLAQSMRSIRNAVAPSDNQERYSELFDKEDAEHDLN